MNWKTRPTTPRSRRTFLDRSLGTLAVLVTESTGVPVLSAAKTAEAAEQAQGVQPPSILKGTTLRYWDFMDPKAKGPRPEALRQIQESFTRDTGVRMDVEVMPYVQIEPNMIQAAAAGKTPDVVRVTSRALALHVHAKTIMPLNDLAAKMPHDDWLLPWDTHVWNGQKMGIPIENRTGLLLYRKDYLDKAGQHVPTSLDDLGQVSEKVTAGRVLGFMWGLSKVNRAAAFEEAFLSLYWGAGGGDPFDAKTGRAVFNSSAGVRVFQWLHDMVYKYHGLPKEAVSYDYEKTVDGVKSGTLAMAFAGTFRVVATRSAGRLGDNLKTAPVPGFTAGIPCVASTSGWVYCIGKDCKNPQAAWGYIEHAVSRESQVINARLGGELPSRKSTYNDPWFKRPEAAELVSWKDYIDKYGRALKYPERYLDAMENLADEAGAVILNNKPIQQALDDAAKNYNVNL